jgi:hypothetical protein
MKTVLIWSVPKMKISIILMGVITIILLSSVVLATKTNEILISYSKDINEISYEVRKPQLTQFTIKNNEDIQRTVIIQRLINNGMGETLTSYPGGEIKYLETESIGWPYLEYEITLGPDEEKEIGFEIKYRIIPTNSLIELEEIKVLDKSSRSIITTSEKNKYIKIECNSDGICDKNIHENYKNCPQDCISGNEDSWCDGQKDGKCDPDCLAHLDKDCKEGEGNQKVYSLRTKMIKEKKQLSEEKTGILQDVLDWFKNLF